MVTENHDKKNVFVERKAREPQKMQNSINCKCDANVELVNRLDELVQKLAQLEYQKQKKDGNELVDKFDSILIQVEKILEKQEGHEQEKLSQLEYSIEKWLRITEASGRVVEIVASSLHVLIGSIMKLVKEQKATAKKPSTPASAENGQGELTDLMSSINKFISELSPDSKQRE